MFTPREKEIFDITGLSLVHKLEAEYFFFLPVENGTFRLGLKIYEQDTGGFTFVQSHFVKEPYKESDRLSEMPVSSSAESALESAVDAISSFYHAAVRAGEQTQSWWFVPNDQY